MIFKKFFKVKIFHIYGRIFSLNVQDASNFIIMVAADELLQELVDYLQKYLVENKSEWMEQHFELIHRTSFQSNNLLELQQFVRQSLLKKSLNHFTS